ncbi:hypothetical protein CSUB01_10878 [Colletotrichum sublineola]|uniref:Uncharacterized protein n=1 Tax=Colletotrichum sublineola TaxID=1173701 RepID=A0A066XVH8_COLSU|nr:hypothetical protein CSUB01_10878 [Colletotrichum sublineola]
MSTSTTMTESQLLALPRNVTPLVTKRPESEEKPNLPGFTTTCLAVSDHGGNASALASISFPLRAAPQPPLPDTTNTTHKGTCPSLRFRRSSWYLSSPGLQAAKIPKSNGTLPLSSWRLLQPTPRITERPLRATQTTRHQRFISLLGHANQAPGSGNTPATLQTTFSPTQTTTSRQLPMLRTKKRPTPGFRAHRTTSHSPSDTHLDSNNRNGSSRRTQAHRSALRNSHQLHRKLWPMWNNMRLHPSPYLRMDEEHRLHTVTKTPKPLAGTKEQTRLRITRDSLRPVELLVPIALAGEHGND